MDRSQGSLVANKGSRCRNSTMFPSSKAIERVCSLGGHPLQGRVMLLSFVLLCHVCVACSRFLGFSRLLPSVFALSNGNHYFSKKRKNKKKAIDPISTILFLRKCCYTFKFGAFLEIFGKE